MKKGFLLIGVLLVCCCFNFPEKVAELQEVIQVEDFNILGDRAYITEKTTIYIYSLKDFKLIKKFGSKGEGPSEFMFTPSLTPAADRLILQGFGKLSVFLPDGTFKEEFRLPRNVRCVLPMSKNLVGEHSVVDRKNKKMKRTIKIFDRDFKTLSEIAHDEEQILITDSKRVWNAINDYFGYSIYGDRIYVADSSKGFFISVFDGTGKKLYDIKHPYEKKKVTSQYKEEYFEKRKKSRRWKSINNQYKFVFPEHFPAFLEAFVFDGKIYAFTYEKKDKKGEVFVMDLKGKILKRTFFRSPRGNYSIHDGYWYYLVENEETEIWELHREKIE